MIAIIGTSDRPCWLAETCKILLLLLLKVFVTAAVCHPEPEALPDAGQAQPDSPSPGGLHHAGVCQLLAEPECQQCRGAAVSTLQPDCVPPTGLLPLLQGECLPVPPLQVSHCLSACHALPAAQQFGFK